MKKLYVKSEQTFALVFIAIYCVSQSLANPLSRAVGVEGSFHAVFSIALTALRSKDYRQPGVRGEDTRNIFGPGQKTCKARTAPAVRYS